MRSFDSNDRLISRSSATLGQTKYSTVDGRGGRCKSIPRQLSYSDFMHERSGGVGAPGDAAEQWPDPAAAAPRDEETSLASEPRTFSREFTEPELVMLEASPRAAHCRCTCDKKLSSIFYNTTSKLAAYHCPCERKQNKFLHLLFDTDAGLVLSSIVVSHRSTTRRWPAVRSKISRPNYLILMSILYFHAVFRKKVLSDSKPHNEGFLFPFERVAVRAWVHSCACVWRFLSQAKPEVRAPPPALGGVTRPINEGLKRRFV
ncbi:hypothetical protein EVAR_83851_1 [Eumeta japonica]|uniref:Uncharacterized protein n=1 Tax=Eumeta variegata TaxID=151549 RepID=A0A4C1USJ2_EUMVA|nr:hypothetical protein EVAR_83851_1 [Eumeta japonica]